MNEDEESLTPEEKLQMENNLLKLKLMAEHEAHFPDENELDPEMENEWLKHIYQFEEQHKNARQISVYEYISRPEFKKADDLTNKQVEEELDRVLDIMGENGINLDCLAEYDDRTIYTFITDELFNHEIDDVKMEGMTTNFIYEEFHPNHDYDLRNYTHEFFEKLLSRKWDKYDEHMLYNHVLSSSDEKIDQKDFITLIELFQEGWKQFELLQQEIVSVVFDIEKAHATVDLNLSYDAIASDNGRTKYAGKSTLTFIHDHGYWYVHKVEMPGFGR